MNIIYRSILFGAITEVVAFGVSAGMVICGGYGPCGPASSLSAAGILLQMPAFFLVEWGLNVPEPLDLVAIVAIQTVVWSSIWLGIHRLRGLQR